MISNYRCLIFTIICSLTATNVCGQLTTSDFRDASGTGPYPVYIGFGIGQTWKFRDLQEINSEMSTENDRNRLNGLQVFLGTSIIPEESNLSFVAELSFLYFTRGQNFRVESNQLSFGVGMRYVLAPFIVSQFQVGPILSHRRSYRLETPGRFQQIAYNEDSKPFNEWNAKIRFGILDPAGTEGGLGAFVELGYNWLRRDGASDELTRVIRLVDDQFQEMIGSRRRYGYISAGILIPLALRF